MDKRTVDIPCLLGHVHKADAYVFGQWAATPFLLGGCIFGEGWTITHVLSGRSISSIVGQLTEPVAIQVAEQLSLAVPNIPDWREISPDLAELIVKTALSAAKENSHDVVPAKRALALRGESDRAAADAETAGMEVTRG